MSIRKLRAARVNTTTASTFVGQPGDIFYDEGTGQLKISDGTTRGGRYIPLVIATPTVAGAIKAGPGANVSVDGTLTIDTTGLPLSIGDLNISQANISTVNANENLNLITNGTGAVNIVGNLHIHTTAQGPDYPTPILEANNYGNVITNGNLIVNGLTVFNGNTVRNGITISNGNVTWNGNTVTNGPAINNGPTTFNGNVTIAGNTNVTGTTTVTGNITVTGNSIQTGQAAFIVSTNSMNTGGLEITGNAAGLVQPPALPGVMLHVTGQDNGTTPGRVYVDGVGQYSILVGRRYNGTIANPTQAVTGDEVLRIAATGYPTGGWPLTGLAQIRFIADENQTQTNRGGHIDFLTVPIGSNVVTQVMSISATTGANIASNLTVQSNIRIINNNTTANSFNKTGGTATANGTTGQLTTNADSLAKGAAGTFTVNNSFVGSKDVVIVNIASGGLTNSYAISVTAVAAGSFQVTITNNGTGALAEALVINFAVIKTT